MLFDHHVLLFFFLPSRCQRSTLRSRLPLPSGSSARDGLIQVNGAASDWPELHRARSPCVLGQIRREGGGGATGLMQDGGGGGARRASAAPASLYCLSL